MVLGSPPRGSNARFTPNTAPCKASANRYSVPAFIRCHVHLPCIRPRVRVLSGRILGRTLYRFCTGNPTPKPGAPARTNPQTRKEKIKLQYANQEDLTTIEIAWQNSVPHLTLPAPKQIRGWLRTVELGELLTIIEQLAAYRDIDPLSPDDHARAYVGAKCVRVRKQRDP